MKVSTIIASAAVTKRATEHGELTCHAGGIGACGWAIAPGEVAISYNDLFALQTPNDNPLCGKTIQATAGGVTKTVATAAVPASAAISPSLRSTSTPSASPPPWVACQSTGRTLSESKLSSFHRIRPRHLDPASGAGAGIKNSHPGGRRWW